MFLFIFKLDLIKSSNNIYFRKDIGSR